MRQSLPPLNIWQFKIGEFGGLFPPLLTLARGIESIPFDSLPLANCSKFGLFSHRLEMSEKSIKLPARGQSRQNQEAERQPSRAGQKPSFSAHWQTR